MDADFFFDSIEASRLCTTILLALFSLLFLFVTCGQNDRRPKRGGNGVLASKRDASTKKPDPTQKPTPIEPASNISTASTVPTPESELSLDTILSAANQGSNKKKKKTKLVAGRGNKGQIREKKRQSLREERTQSDRSFGGSKKKHVNKTSSRQGIREEPTQDGSERGGHSKRSIAGRKSKSARVKSSKETLKTAEYGETPIGKSRASKRSKLPDSNRAKDNSKRSTRWALDQTQEDASTRGVTSREQLKGLDQSKKGQSRRSPIEKTGREALSGRSKKENKLLEMRRKLKKSLYSNDASVEKSKSVGPDEAQPKTQTSTLEEQTSGRRANKSAKNKKQREMRRLTSLMKGPSPKKEKSSRASTTSPTSKSSRTSATTKSSYASSDDSKSSSKVGGKRAKSERPAKSEKNKKISRIVNAPKEQ